MSTMFRCMRAYLCYIFFVYLAVFSSGNFANAAELLSVEEVDAAIASLEKDATDASKAEVLNWQQTLENLSAITQAKARIDALESKLKEFEKRKPISEKSLQIDDLEFNIESAKSQEILDRVKKLQSQIHVLEKRRTEYLASLSIEQTNSISVDGELTKLKAKLETLSALLSPQSAGKDALSQQRLSEERSLELELITLGLQKEVAMLAIPILEKDLKVIRQVTEGMKSEYVTLEKRANDIERQKSQWIKDSANAMLGKFGVKSRLAEIAQTNIDVAELLIQQSSGNNVEVIQADALATTALLAQIRRQEKSAKDRIKLIEYSGENIDRSTGDLLRRQRASLPSNRELKRRLREAIRVSTQHELASIQLNQWKIHYPLDLEGFLVDNDADIPAGLTVEDVREMIKLGVLQVDRAIKSQDAMVGAERPLIIMLKETQLASARYSSFLDTRLLWIASHPVMDLNAVKAEGHALLDVFSVSRWGAWWSSIVEDVMSLWYLWCAVFVSVVSLLWGRKWLKPLALKQNKLAQRKICVSMTPTLVAILIQFALVLPFLLLGSFIGWRSSGDVVIATGVFSMTFFGCACYLLYRLSRAEGVFVSHFQFNRALSGVFCRMMKFYMLFGMVFFGIGKMLALGDSATEIEGRLVWCLNVLLAGASMYYLWRNGKKYIHVRTRKALGLLYGLGLLLVLALVFVNLQGYFISMLTIVDGISHSLGVCWILVMVFFVLKRWMVISRRSIVMKSAQAARRESLPPEQEQSRKEELQRELEAVTEGSIQSQKLLKVVSVIALLMSMYAIWSGTLPALSVLDDVRLWKVEQSVSKSESPPVSVTSIVPGVTDLSQAEDVMEVADLGGKGYKSLQDLLMSILCLVGTYFCATNIPGLLRLTILDKLNLGAGSAFGVTTVVRYTIIIVGIVFACGLIGITWGKVQWIAAAVTLGIGFGLQEIFANFVAGLIILFERPIRIGDMVTVGGVNGRVHRIQMRATTILQFNNRELIVPNKEFITTQLVNWTLTTTVMRTKIVVGIAYGSDTEKATKLLQECASKNPRVLREPLYDVIFSSFGASSLDFELRVYVDTVDNLIPVQSELHYAVDHAFREAGIEIAFPQQDIHIRSNDAIFTSATEASEVDSNRKG